jgi:Transposase IS4
MNTVGQQLRKGWTLGKKCCVDESMIKYKGKAVTWVQYMPKKPIRHGLKVFALNCAYTGYLYCFKVYTGKENLDGSPKAVIERLMLAAGYTFTVQGQGRILYTDSFYTSLEVMHYIYITFGVLMVGTYVLSKKKSRTAADYPFHKVSKPTLDKTERGWMRSAVKSMFHKGNLLFKVQATVWKDKKEIGFLHNYLVTTVEDDTENVQRWDKVKRRKVRIRSPRVVKDYQANMNGVDRKDRDTADWGTSIRTCRYYLRIFFWNIDGILHAMYCIIVFLGSEMSTHKWKGYCSKNGGREKFQKDLAQKVIEYGIRLDWTDVTDENAKPAYMRNMAYVPCDCKTCFFCIEGLTHGVDHRSRGHQATIEVGTCPNNRTIIANSPGRCRLCYQQLRLEHPDWTVERAKSKCHKTRMGCCKCQVIICETCWPSFGHDLEAKK